MRKLIATLAGLFGRSSDRITESTRLSEIIVRYPSALTTIQAQYGLNVRPEETRMRLRAFVKRYSLPSPQIVFMQIQLGERDDSVPSLSPRAAQHLLHQQPHACLLDIREHWERNVANLPNAQPLSQELMDEMVETWNRDRPLVLFCHFGIRSRDAAHALIERGFKNVYVLKGGIDGWSQEVDRSVPQYESAWC